jgi:hypothetical protein
MKAAQMAEQMVGWWDLLTVGPSAALRVEHSAGWTVAG